MILLDHSEKMMTSKNIYTLVDDINEVLLKGTDITDEQADEFGKNMSSLIKDRLQPRRQRKPSLRLSGIGKDDYQLWYEMNGYKHDQDLPPNVYFKFLFGDVIEEIVLTLAKLAGHKVEEQQGEVIVEGVKGHKDARVDGVTVDVKSASTFAFKKFKQGTMLDKPSGFDKQYLMQLASYIQGDAGKEGNVDDRGAFLAVDKQNGHIALLEVVDFFLPDAAERVKHVKEMVKAEAPPPCSYEPVPDGKSGNMVLPAEGSYCPYKFQVWKESNNGLGLRVFAYSSGPRFFTHIEKEPAVQEITHSFLGISEEEWQAKVSNYDMGQT